MTRKMTTATLVLALAFGLIATDAMAWGERAKQSLSAMGLQLLKEHYPSIFRPGGVSGPNFEKDVLRGAKEGYDVLRATLPMHGDQETLQSVGNEIQLLRDVRRYGATSYFAYRMGVLSAMVADTMLPFGFAWQADELAIQAQMNEDIDAALDGYKFNLQKGKRVFIRDIRLYYQQHRTFYAQDKTFIASDYTTGNGYQGFLKDGGPAYFTRTVEAIADVWYTVLNDDPHAPDGKASRRALAWYFVNEIEYLVSVKHNLHQADKAYSNFSKVNPQITATFERLGDLYYRLNTYKEKQRGVREWHNAFEIGGPERKRIARKLSKHYLSEGATYLAKADTEAFEKSDVPTALKNFETALEYNRTSAEAADYIEKAHKKNKEIEEHYNLMLSFNTNGDNLSAKAGQFRMNGDFHNAIGTYKQAISVYEGVDSKFKDLEKDAVNKIRTNRKNISEVINSVLDEASNAIDKGEEKKDTHDYPGAIGEYSKVPDLLAVIPEDKANESLVEQKNELIAMAQQRIEEAKKAKVRYDEAKKSQEQAAQARQ